MPKIVECPPDAAYIARRLMLQGERPEAIVLLAKEHGGYRRVSLPEIPRGFLQKLGHFAVIHEVIRGNPTRLRTGYYQRSMVPDEKEEKPKLELVTPEETDGAYD